MLIPARTDTLWFREAFEHVQNVSDVQFLSGRITFEGASNPAPFPSCVIVLRRPEIWASNDGARYVMPKRHGTRPRWYTITSPVKP